MRHTLRLYSKTTRCTFIKNQVGFPYKIKWENLGMDEIRVAEAVFRVIRERRQGVVDLMQYGSVKSLEQYRELMGNLEALNHVEQELKDLLDKQERSVD